MIAWHDDVARSLLYVVSASGGKFLRASEVCAVKINVERKDLLFLRATRSFIIRVHTNKTKAVTNAQARPINLAPELTKPILAFLALREILLRVLHLEHARCYPTATKVPESKNPAATMLFATFGRQAHTEKGPPGARIDPYNQLPKAWAAACPESGRQRISSRVSCCVDTFGVRGLTLGCPRLRR